MTLVLQGHLAIIGDIILSGCDPERHSFIVDESASTEFITWSRNAQGWIQKTSQLSLKFVLV
jgi:hypothetical protein